MILFLFLLIATADLKAAVVSDRTEIRLSESIRLTVTVEGPTPLAVSVPLEWLAEDSTSNWRARTEGTATVTSLTNNRERWSLTLRLDPYATGNPLPLSLQSIDVRAGIDPAPQKMQLTVSPIRVTTDVGRVSAEEARPITGIEDVPETTRESHFTSWIVFISILVSFVVIVRLRKRQNNKPELTTKEWLTREIADLNTETNPQKIAQKSADLIRRFVHRRFGLSLDCRTTIEAVQIIDATDSIPDTVNRDDLKLLLNDSDRIQFDPHGIADAIPLRDHVIRWISESVVH